MGSISFLTVDTEQSITTAYSPRGAMPTKMVWVEDGVLFSVTELRYLGRADFGGINFFSLTDLLNGGSGDCIKGLKLWHRYNDDDRKAAMLKADKDNVVFPRLVSMDWAGNEDSVQAMPLNRDCEQRGYFHDEFEKTDFSF